MTARDAFLRATQRAVTKAYLIASPQRRAYQRYCAGDAPWNDRFTPGRLIESLSDEEREALRSLTAADTQDRAAEVLP